MKGPKKSSQPSAYRKLQQLIKNSPAPPLAKANLARLMESGGAKSVTKIPSADLPALIRLLGSSAYLSDVLIQQGTNWPELFLRQVNIKQKTVDTHLRELE